MTTISSVSGDSGNDYGKKMNVQKGEAQPNGTIWDNENYAAADNTGSGGNRDGSVDVKEMGLNKSLKKINKFIEKFEKSVSSTTRTFFNAVKAMASKLGESIYYKRDNIAEQDLEKQIQLRQNDAEKISNLIQTAKDDAAKAVDEYNRTSFESDAGKAALEASDNGHNEKAEALRKEKTQADAKNDLHSKIFDSFIDIVKRSEGLEHFDDIDKTNIYKTFKIKDLKIKADVRPDANGTDNDVRDSKTGQMMAAADKVVLTFSYESKDGQLVEFTKTISTEGLPKSLVGEDKTRIRGSEVEITEKRYDEMDIDDL